MNIRDVKQVLKTMVENKVNVTPMLWARHGIGKSSVVTQLAKEIGYDCLTVTLSQKEAVDLAGMLYTAIDVELKMNVTASNPPDWFARALKKGKLILFLDEFNMARREVLNAAFELVLDRRLNNMKLPDDVFIVCAGNPDDERYDVTPLSESLRDRLMHIKVTPDVDAWLDWANAAKVNPEVINFVKCNPEAAFFEDKRDDKFPVDIKHSFRSWERLATIHAMPLDNRLKFECYQGIVGPNYAMAFVRSLNLDASPIAPELIVNFNSAVADQVKALIEPNMRIDLLSKTVDDLVAFSFKNKTKATQSLDALVKFIAMLPEDCAAVAIKGLSELPGFAQAVMNSEELSVKIAEISKIAKVAKAFNRKA